MFEDLKTKFDILDPPPYQIPSGKIELIKEKFPGIPDEYLALLGEIGAGDLDIFNLYSGPIPAGNFFKEREEALEGIILIGDDFQGYKMGFDINEDFQLIEVDPRGKLKNHLERTFGELLLRKLRNRGWR